MRATLRPIGFLLFLFILFTLPAQAQLGSMIRKAAKKAVEGKVDEKVDEATPVAPLAGDPLTASTLDAVLKGLSLELESSARSKQLWADIEAKAKEATEAERLAGNAPDAWHRASRDVERCISKSLDKSNKQHEQDMPQKMMALMSSANSNPATLAKLQAAGKAMSDAQAKGDTPAYVRAFNNYAKILGFDVVRDSAVAFAACGKLPPKPASMVAFERLKADVERLSDERRALEEESELRAAKVAGMPGDKYALARERLWAWSAARKQKQGSRALTKDENALIAARADELKQFAGILR